jgi:hypothetical protein
MNDLNFVAGKFLFEDIPLEYEYLKYYFTTPLERVFLSYFILLGNYYCYGASFLRFYDNFQDHTGYLCSTRWVRKLIKRYNFIEKELQEASKKPDLLRVSKIKMGALFNDKFGNLNPL